MEHRSFGCREPGVVYRDRAGAYAVILDDRGNAALVEAPAAGGPERGLFLPGGGIEPEETPEECLRRECLEELGREIFSAAPGRSTSSPPVMGATSM